MLLNPERDAIVIEELPVPIWVVGPDYSTLPDDSPRIFYLPFIDMISYWLWQISSSMQHIIEPLRGLTGCLIIELNLAPSGDWLEIPSDSDNKDSYQSISEFVSYNVQAAEYKISLEFSSPIKRPLLHPDNRGEREIIAVLLSAMRELLHKLNVTTTGDLNDDLISKAIDTHAPLGSKKKLIMLPLQDPRLDDRALPRLRKVQHADQQEVLDEVGHYLASSPWNVGSISTQSRNELLHAIVDHLYVRLGEVIASLSPDDLLDWLISHNESINREVSFSQFIIPARLACFYSETEMKKTLAEEIPDLNQAAMASRFLIEYMATCPPKGLRPICLEVYDLLMALSLQIMEYGALSERIYFNIDDPSLHILPSGRLAVDQESYHHAIEQFLPEYSAGSIRKAKESFASAWHVAKIDAQSQTEFDILYDRAFIGEFGYSIEQFGRMCGEAVNIGYTQSQPMKSMNIAEFIREISKNTGISASIVTAFTNQLTLEPRDEFLEPGPDFRSEDENEYTGNPGNPASFTWPHLTEVNSGYGGTISFSYTQIPDTTATSIWTREVVTTRTINGGISASQSYTYTYTGNPQYLGLGWDQKYRGFTEVKETDSAGNYVKYWFYTTGEVDGKDAERLSGEEYKTQWFNSSDVLLRERVYDWTWHSTSQTYDFLLSWSSSGTGDEIVNDGEGITVSSDGYVYVTDNKNDRVQKFDADGNFILKWGSEGTGDGQFRDPVGVAVSSDGYVYVTDYYNHRVQKFDADGNFVLNWGSEGTGDGQFRNPHRIAVSSDGYVYVTDYNNHRVQKFDADGNFILKWGSEGTGDGQFKDPHGIAVSSDGYVYVADYKNHRVQKFDADGNFVLKWGSEGTGDGQFKYPRGIAVSSDGYVYVTEHYWGSSNDRVQKFDADGNFILNWGSYGTGDGQFKYPRGIAVSSDGYVYVTEHYWGSSNDRVQKFDADGNFVLKWGSEGEGNGQFRDPRGIAVSGDGCVYVAELGNDRVQKFDADGNFILNWGSLRQFKDPEGIAVSSDGYVYVVDTENERVQKFDADGNFVLKWGSYGTGDGQFEDPEGIAVSGDGYVYVTDNKNDRVQKFDADGNFILKWDGFRNYVRDVAVSTNCMYVMTSYWGGDVDVDQLMYNWAVRLSGVDETIGSKTSRTRYEYDDYGNVITTYLDGDLDTNDDDATIHRVFYPNDTANILSKPARERVYATITDDVGGANLKKETLYYYDGNDTSWTTPPTQGNLSRLEQEKDESASVSSYFTYDTYGNMLTSQDPNGSTTTWTYETTHHTYPESKTYPITGLSESYTYDVGTFNLLSLTDVNGQTTTYQYDTFKRLLKVIKPGDSESSPGIEYQYNDWGTLNQQHVKTLAKVADDDYLWQSDYFDGLGRVVQVQARGETGRTIISTTTTFNDCGLVEKQYVSQDLDSSQVNGYKAPEAGWKYTSYEYDGLGRVTTQTNADGTTISHDYSIAWQELVTNEGGLKKRYYYDAFRRLIQIEELDDIHQVYATTEYSYNVVGNLTQVVDDSSNTITISYDWLSRKTAMTDPDMGSWSYGYDDNSNLTSQTDAKGQTVNFTYDALNRLTGKSYPEGSGMTDVTYTYDSTDGDNYGKGQRTGMTDALGATSYKYDARGRLIEETRAVDSMDYTTQFAYDGADRVTSITYPTGETVTQEYNGRGLPYSLSGSVAGDLVTSTLYNHLGQINKIYLGNGQRTMFGYWDVGTIYDTTGGYYGRLWRVQTAKAPWNDLVVQDEKYTWDAAGNLTLREDILAAETETFTYDFLDRLTSAAGPYSESYTYNEIGNITSKNGISYTYGSKPHAVTAVGSTSYTYDANGNMTARGSQTITWDVENRPVSITDGANTSAFIYDGDGNRVKKTEGGETILYVNKYYEKNLTTDEVTTYYFHGAKLVAMCQGTELSYIHQDHLTSTAVMTDSSGNELGTIKYFPFGATRSGSVPTDKKFTGQRLDETGLYYYGARYYDANIGRFISADSIVPNFMNPQSLNRYSYCLNNPLKYTDPTGHNSLFCYLFRLRSARPSPPLPECASCIATPCADLAPLPVTKMAGVAATKWRYS